MPRALGLVGLSTKSLVHEGWRGSADVDWLARVGRLGWIVFSCNKRMLTVPDERATIIREKVGVLFLTGGEENLANVLKLLLTKWDLLELLDNTEPKPFARFLSPHGRITTKFRQYEL